MSDLRLLNIRDLGPRRTWPGDVVRIDRRSRWGNRWRLNPKSETSRRVAIGHYRRWLTADTDYTRSLLEPLRGKRLACWCAPLPCHGDVILEWLDSHPVAP